MVKVQKEGLYGCQRSIIYTYRSVHFRCQSIVFCDAKPSKSVSISGFDPRQSQYPILQQCVSRGSYAGRLFSRGVGGAGAAAFRDANCSSAFLLLVEYRQHHHLLQVWLQQVCVCVCCRRQSPQMETTGFCRTRVRPPLSVRLAPRASVLVATDTQGCGQVWLPGVFRRHGAKGSYLTLVRVADRIL